MEKHGFVSREVRRSYINKAALLLLVSITCLCGQARIEIPATENALKAAAEQGGDILITNGCVIVLVQPIVVTLPMTVSAIQPVTLSGAQDHRVFEIRSGGSLELAGLTLVDGRATSGGAVYNDGDSFTARACTFRGNRARAEDGGQYGALGNDAYGGAIFSNSRLLLAGCLFEDNHAAGGNGASGSSTSSDPNGSGGHASGGAIATTGSAVLSNCVFVGNDALGGMGGSTINGKPGGSGGAGIGGAIRGVGTLVIRSAGFSNNAALGGMAGTGGGAGGPAGGGAVAIESGNLHLSCIQFIGNRAVGAPGSAAAFGVVQGASGGESTGSAVYVDGGDSVIERCTMRHNLLQGGDGSAAAGSSSNPGELSGGNGGSGGGVNGTICNIGHMLLSASTFANNVLYGGNAGPGGCGSPGGAGGEGGHCYGGGLCNMGTVTLKNCTITSNLCMGGLGGAGGVGDHDSSSPGMGGAGAAAVWTDMHDDEAILESCTLAGNSVIAGPGGKGGADDQGGPAADGVPGAFRGVNLGSMGMNHVRNTICSSASPGPQAVGMIMDLGGNLCSDGTCQFTNRSSLNNTDPRLLSLAENGGPTLTLAPRKGSPAIHRALRSSSPACDQRGYLRFPAGRHDIGAVETSAHRGLTVCGLVSDGTNGIGGVNVTAGRVDAVTDATGYYEIFGIGQGVRVVQPVAEGLSFTPRRYRVNVTRNRVLPPFVSVQ